MKLLKLCITGILVMAMTGTAVFAAETTTEAPADPSAETTEQEEGALGGAINALFGEGGPLEGVLPEGTDVEGILSAANEQLQEAGGETAALIGTIVEQAKSEFGNLDEEGLEAYAEDFLNQYLGTSELGGMRDIDAYFDLIDELKVIENEYIKEKNADQLTPGDVEIVMNGGICQDENMDDGDVKTMCCMIQYNYRQEDDKLMFVSSAEDIVMFIQQQDEQGNYQVVDAVFAEDGEGYTASIEAMCEEMGEPIEDCMDMIAFNEVSVPYELINYLNDHPEIKGIEYNGEVMDAEQLNAVWDEAVYALYDTGETADEPVDEAAVEAVEDAAGEAQAESSEAVAEEAPADTAEEAPADAAEEAPAA